MAPVTVCSYSTCPRVCFQGSACPVLRAPCLPEGESFVDGVKHGFHSLRGVNQTRTAKIRESGKEPTTCMRPGSIPSRLAEMASASTFSRVLPRYPIIFAAFAAFCAGEAAERICPSVTGGYMDSQNWRRNSLAAVWHVVNWRKRLSGMSSKRKPDGGQKHPSE